MYLSNTNETIELLLNNTVTTNQIQWVSVYNNVTPNSAIITPKFTDEGVSNDTIPVTIVSAPTGFSKRKIIHLFIFNNDTVAQTVIIRKKVGANTYILYKNSVPINTTLEWSKNTGWQIN